MGVAELPASPQESKLFEQGFAFSVVASRKNSCRPEILAKLAYKLEEEPLSRRLLLGNPVAVEKLGFPEKSRKSGDRKCLEDWGKSFVELPDAKQFLRIRGERVFQQPQGLSPAMSF